jgi:hypothetical protein
MYYLKNLLLKKVKVTDITLETTLVFGVLSLTLPRGLSSVAMGLSFYTSTIV